MQPAMTPLPQPARQSDQFSRSFPPTTLQPIRYQNPPLTAVNPSPFTHSHIHISYTLTLRRRTTPIPLGRRPDLRLELLRFADDLVPAIPPPSALDSMSPHSACPSQTAAAGPDFMSLYVSPHPACPSRSAVAGPDFMSMNVPSAHALSQPKVDVRCTRRCLALCLFVSV